MKKVMNYAITMFGILLLGVGLYLLKAIVEPQGIFLSLPYICIGCGCGIFGHGMGNIFSARAIKNNPEFAKKISIETNDERNVTIGNRAKAKAYDTMVFIFGALMLSYALMGVDMTVILLLVGSYLFVVGCDIYYRLKYEKEM